MTTLFNEEGYMLLERIEVSGFRGIKRLSLSFEQLTTLIGENTWGKSSLLDALSIALPISGELHQFSLTDFHQDHSISYTQDQHIQIIITFQTTEKMSTELAAIENSLHYGNQMKTATHNVFITVLVQQIMTEK